MFRWDAADRSWSEARAGQPDGGLVGGLAGKLSEGVDRLTRRGAGGLRWGVAVPGPAPGSVEEPEAVDRAGPEGAAWAGETDRDLAGLEALYRRTAQAVRPEAPGLDVGGAGIAVRAEEPVSQDAADSLGILNFTFKYHLLQFIHRICLYIDIFIFVQMLLPFF